MATSKLERELMEFVIWQQLYAGLKCRLDTKILPAIIASWDQPDSLKFWLERLSMWHKAAAWLSLQDPAALRVSPE